MGTNQILSIWPRVHRLGRSASKFYGFLVHPYWYKAQRGSNIWQRKFYHDTPQAEPKTLRRQRSSNSRSAGLKSFHKELYQKDYTNLERAKLIEQRFRGPMSPNDRLVERELIDKSSRPIDVLRRCMSNGNASQHVVRLCLEAQYLDHERTPRKDRQELHDLQRKDQLARTVLTLILQDYGNWGAFLQHERHAVDNICILATIEGIEDTVQKFLLVPIEGHVWRGNMIMSLCKAQFILDRTSSADSMLHMYFGVADMEPANQATHEAHQVHNKSSMNPVFSPMELHLARWTMAAMLNQPNAIFRHFRTDVALYDRFIRHFEAEEIRLRRKSPQEVSWDLSRLHLVHPGAMNEGPAIKILEQFAKHGPAALVRPREWEERGIARTIPKFVRQTANVAEATGNMNAAYWVFETFKKEYEMAPPISLQHAEGALRSLTPGPTPEQQRLFNAAVRVGGPKSSNTPQQLVQHSTVVVAKDPAAHAMKFQSMFGSSANTTKKSAQVQASHNFGAAPGWKS